MTVLDEGRNLLRTNSLVAQFRRDLLVRSVGQAASLTEEERKVLCERQQYLRTNAAGTLITDTLSGGDWPKLIVSGWACRESLQPNGRRQLLSLLLPGELVGNSQGLRALDLLEVTAITAVQMVSIAGIVRAVEKEPGRYPGIEAGLIALRRLEERYLLEQLIRLGLQPAVQRLAGLLFELFWRSQAIGLASGKSFAMPLTQAMLGDAVGVSHVHVQRGLVDLKEQRLVTVHSGICRVEDEAGLARAAGLDPAMPFPR